MHISSDKTGETHIQLIVKNNYVNAFFQSHMTFNLIDFMIWREQLKMSIGSKALRLMLYGLSIGVLPSIAYCSVIAYWQIPRKLAPSTSHLLTIHINWYFNNRLYNTNFNQAWLEHYVICCVNALSETWMFTLSFIINSNIGAETKMLTHEDVCALVRQQLHYFPNAN